MSTLPRILVIDDIYGCMRNGRNRDREDFCIRLGLRDVTGDSIPEKVGSPVAEAVFLQGQVEEDGRVKNDLQGTLEQVRDGWATWPRWALLLLDLHFKTGPVGPGGEPVGLEHDRDPDRYFGLKVLDHLWKDPSLRDIPVVIMSAMEREAVEWRFTDRGVFDFTDKSALDRQALWALLKQHGLLKDDKIIGHSLPLLQVLRAARRRAMQGDDNILILGETRTGKELLAQYIHKWSRRPGQHVTLFTQGVPETLIDDRLFGHVKGAFHGATMDVPGAAELANQGTLFIDEFGDIPAMIQNKLLRLLDKNVRSVQRLGSQEVQRLDLQVVMATNRLDILTAKGFRNDLLARAKVRNPIVLPPLRERREDIPLLVEYFIGKFEKTFGAEHRELSQDALDLLLNYVWPENIGELEGVIEDAVYNYTGLRYLSAAHLSLGTHGATSGDAASAGVRRTVRSSGDGISEASKPTPEGGSLPVTEPSGTSLEGILSTDVDSFVEYIIEYTERLDFDAIRVHDLEGKLAKLQTSHARLVAYYLIAALEYTCTPIKRETRHTTAIKLLTGKELKSSPAYGVIVGILREMPLEIGLEALLHPRLEEIYTKAVKNRSAKDIRER